MVPTEDGATAGTRRMSDAESYFVDEEGEPYPPLVRKLIRKVLDGASVGTESKERLARLELS